MLGLFGKHKQAVTVGMQIASGGLSFLVLDVKSRVQPKIKDYVSYTIANGEPLDQLAINIKQYVEENRILKAKSCFVLDDEDYQLLTVESPKVPDDELREAVTWKIKDLITFPIDDVLIDVFLFPENNRSTKKIANVVVHRDVIQNISSFVESVGLNLLAIDVPEMSYRNYIETTEYHEKSIAVVLIKENYGKLIVVQNSHVLFSRSFSIPYNGGLFDNLPESEIALELQRSLDYYERQLKQIVPSRVIFVGENITDDKVTAVIRESLNQEVIIGKVENLADSENQHLYSGRLVAAYGGALRKELYL
ncbi:hypothetical protein AB835_09295 [Candidatus Endobugula sertula]|uniref:SHS2 domain-containing protein n=1 Tax=Candidatus Endobugula sertula TaxID=62101 RepID=A0A1D2QP32_9GAMM|nr:hypothetical protein AB835_09295 [Candidatus Endobugula sertula]